MKSKEPKEANNKKNILKENLTPEEIQIRKRFKIELLICLIHAIIIEIYFIITNTISTSMPKQSFEIYIKISYIIFTIIAILLFEIAYKKEKKNLAVGGTEFIVLAIHTLLIGHSITASKDSTQLSILKTSYVWIIYHCLKAVIIYTKENRRRLKQLSDIAQIVKEEKPTKKVAKKRKK